MQPDKILDFVRPARDTYVACGGIATILSIPKIGQKISKN